MNNYPNDSTFKIFQHPHENPASTCTSWICSRINWLTSQSSFFFYFPVPSPHSFLCFFVERTQTAKTTLWRQSLNNKCKKITPNGFGSLILANSFGSFLILSLPISPPFPLLSFPPPPPSFPFPFSLSVPSKYLNIEEKTFKDILWRLN